MEFQSLRSGDLKLPDLPLRTLVVGAPRSGFTLLISVLSELSATRPSKSAGDFRQMILNTVGETLGLTISDRIVEHFAAEGVAGGLIYNQNFRELTGGPKWIDPANPERACFRKYIGIRGGGDLSLITAHPLATLEHDAVIHSHVDPGLWLCHPEYATYRKFSSIRNPIGILNSSIFSLNALASEYIQKYLPPEQDQDELRQHQALYKLTDMNFFAGLAAYLKRYLEAFLKCRDGYTVMRWEDLIDKPVPTIQAIGSACDLHVSDEEAAAIWTRLDHVNLTGAHKHNYRKGFGIVGNWRQWLTNHHVALIRELGLGPLIDALGYDSSLELDESAYTPFQREVSAMIARGQVYDDYPDRDLFTFAFNKSNIDIDKFKFRRYGWRAHTQIERSCFTDEALELRIWDVAEEAAARFNAFLDDLLAGDYATAESAFATVDQAFGRHEAVFGGQPSGRFSQALAACHRILSLGSSANTGPPRLVKSIGVYNIVHYAGQFYGLPQALGPVDLEVDRVDGRPGVVIAVDLEPVEADIRHQLATAGENGRHS
jgi:hypothetical protein